MSPQRRKTVYLAVKRALDVLAAALGLVLCALPVAVMALLILAEDGGPVLFAQERVGRYGKIFRMYKLRTLKKTAPPNAPAGQIDQRAASTKVGWFLRRTSLDELPQLVNVLKGDMSLVGPRPLIPEETDIHNMRMDRGVYALRPGLTGLAQIHGRDRIGPEEKIAWDVCYARAVSLKTDIDILCRTVSSVIHDAKQNDGI